jgi:hypothetical protein
MIFRNIIFLYIITNNMPKTAMEIIPHQLHLTKAQKINLIKGKPVNVSHANMGSGAGNVVITLTPTNARKMMTAYKNGKGVRLSMSQPELMGTYKHGKGFFDDVGSFFTRDIPTFFTQTAPRFLIRDAVPAVVGGLTGIAAGVAGANPVLGAVAGAAASAGTKAGTDALADQLGLGLYGVSATGGHGLYGVMGSRGGRGKLSITHGGGKMKKGSPEMKAHMAKLRAMRKGNKGEGILDDIKAGAERAGQFVKEGAKKAIDLVGGEKAAKDLGIKAGKMVLDPLANVIGSAVEKKFGKSAGEAVKLAMKKAGAYGLDKLDEYDLTEESAEAIKKEAKDLVIDEVKEAIDNLKPEIRSVALEAMMSGGDKKEAVKKGAKKIGEKAKKYAMEQLKKPYQRKGKIAVEDFSDELLPNPIGGEGVRQSKPYRRVMRDTFNAPVIANPVGNAPVANFRPNPRVMPSSTLMTLSPFQTPTAPAMNPFTPTTYAQEGGQGSGYGGIRLQGIRPADTRGHSAIQVRGASGGRGLYGINP